MPFDLKSAQAELKKVPWWGWAAGGGVALGAGYIIHQRNASAPASQAPASPVPDGLNAADLAGLPFDYQNYGPSQGGTPGTSQGSVATIRLRYSDPGDPQVEAWDKSHTGVPERSAPGGAVTQMDPFGGTVDLTGQTETGPANIPNDPHASTEWLQLADGAWISAYDLAGQWQANAAGMAQGQAAHDNAPQTAHGGGPDLSEHSFPQEAAAGVYEQ